MLLDDLTSTYFESEPPSDATDKRRHGYSRDQRSDCVQLVLGLIVTTEGFALAYEVLAGNSSDKTTQRPGVLALPGSSADGVGALPFAHHQSACCGRPRASTCCRRRIRSS